MNTITNLILEKNEITARVLAKLKKDKVNIKVLADGMAESAMHIQSQGYNNFLSCREAFLAEVERVSDDYENYICSKIQ